MEGDRTYDTEAETDETTETETEEEDFNGKPDGDLILTIAGKSLKSEPKHIVFLSQLLVLFNFCHICKADNPSVEARQIGKKAIVTSTCCNPKCPKPVNHCHSQPNMPDSGIAAGNFLLCMAILLAGGSASKGFQIFAHMGLGCASLNTFFKCQRRNQVGSSPAMEFMGFKQCMEYLLGCGITITTFISDRHTSMASHMKKVLTHIVHYFDIWHLKKKIRKVLSKLEREKGCEVLADWIKPCENHLFLECLNYFQW